MGTKARQDRIVHGDPAVQDQFPYQVSFRLQLFNQAWATEVVKWSASLPSTLTIPVLIPLKF